MTGADCGVTRTISSRRAGAQQWALATRPGVVWQGRGLAAPYADCFANVACRRYVPARFALALAVV